MSQSQPTRARASQPPRPASAWRPRTKFICTLGPATSNQRRIQDLLKAGMSIARLNLSHDSYQNHARLIASVRSEARALGMPVGILADVPGPKYRLGRLPEKGVAIEEGWSVEILSSAGDGTGGSIHVVPPNLHKDVTPKDSLLVDDGLIQLEVVDVHEGRINCRSLSSGILLSSKGVVCPGKAPSLPYLTEDTERALRFIAENDVDFAGLSCVRTREDIEVARSLLERSGERMPRLVTKIERAVAMQNLDELIEASDVVMVARGDLGVDIPLARVPLAQKRIIQECNQKGVAVITATQMLESMITTPLPTRAEATDVANAIFDGSDAVMLSGETSVGRYPVRALRMMADIARATEAAIQYDRLLVTRDPVGSSQTDDVIAYNACLTASRLGASLIIAFTESGGTAARVSRNRPGVPVLALTPNEHVLQSLTVNWGVVTMQCRRFDTLEELFLEGQRVAIDSGLAKEGDLVVLVAGVPVGMPGHTNLIRVLAV